MFNHLPAYEVKIYVGQRRGYDGPLFDRTELVDLCKSHQKETGLKIPVRVSRTHFVVGDYEEPGFELAAINFPTDPHEPRVIVQFMIDMADRVCTELDQEHVSVVTPDKMFMRTKFVSGSPAPETQ